MTDLQRFIKLYESFGITNLEQLQGDGGTQVYLEVSHDQPKFGGYASCYSYVQFDLNGTFVFQNFVE